MKNKFFLLPVILILCFNMIGCWDNFEIAERNIVTMIGIDKAPEKGKIILSLQLVLPDRLSSPSKPTFTEKTAVSVVEFTGRSISEAIANFRKQISTIPLFQHSRVLIIGEEIAKEGITPIMDFFSRSFEVKPSMQVWVTPGKAKEIVNWKGEVSKIPANYILELLSSDCSFSFWSPLDCSSLV